MPEALTDEQMGIRPSTQTSAKPLTDDEMGLIGGPALTDAQMDAPPTQVHPNVIKNAMEQHRQQLGRDLTPIEQRRIEARMKLASPVTPREAEVQQAVEQSNTATGVSGFAKSIVKGAVKGAYSIAQGAEAIQRDYSPFGGQALDALGVPRFFDPETVASHTQAIDKIAPTTDSTLNTVGEAGGHMLPGLAAAAATGGAAAIPTFAAVGGAEGIAAAQNETQQARDAGQEVGGFEQHAAQIGYGIANAIISALGGKALSMANGAASTLGRVGAKAAVGGVMGAGTKGAENVIAKGTFDPDRSAMEGTGEAALGGAAGAGIFGIGEEFFRDRSGRSYRKAAQNPQQQSALPPGSPQPQPGPSAGAKQSASANPRPSGAAPKSPAIDPVEAMHRQYLGLPADGLLDYEQIKAAFRKRVMETHPDRSGYDSSADFAKVVRAGEYMEALYPQPSRPRTKESRPNETAGSGSPTESPRSRTPATPQTPAGQSEARSQTRETESRDVSLPKHTNTGVPNDSSSVAGSMAVPQGAASSVVPSGAESGNPVSAPVSKGQPADVAAVPEQPVGQGAVDDGGGRRSSPSPAPLTDQEMQIAAPSQPEPAKEPGIADRTGVEAAADVPSGPVQRDVPDPGVAEPESRAGGGADADRGMDRGADEPVAPKEVANNEAVATTPAQADADQAERGDPGVDRPADELSASQLRSLPTKKLNAIVDEAKSDLVNHKISEGEFRRRAKIAQDEIARRDLKTRLESGDETLTVKELYYLSDNPKASQMLRERMAKEDTERRAQMIDIHSGDPNVKLWSNKGDEKAMGAIAAKMGKIKNLKLPDYSKPGSRSVPAPRKLPKYIPSSAPDSDRFKELAKHVGLPNRDFDLSLAKVDKGGKRITATDGHRLISIERDEGRFAEAGDYRLGDKLVASSSSKATPDIHSIIHSNQAENASAIDPATTLRHLRQIQAMMADDARGVAVVRNEDGSLGFAAYDPKHGYALVNVRSSNTHIGSVNPEYLHDLIESVYKLSGNIKPMLGWDKPTKPIVIKASGGGNHVFGLLMPVNTEAGRTATDIQTAMHPETKPEPKSKKASARNKGMAYTGWLEPVVESAGEAGKGFVNLAVRDQVDRVAQLGTPSAKQAADLADKAINTSKAAAGSIAKYRDKALTIAGGGLSPVRHKALMSLQRIVFPKGKTYGTARALLAIEGKIPAASLTPTEQEIVAAIRELTDATGKGYKANGIQQYNHKTEQWQPFNYIAGGRVFVNLHTPESMDAIMAGKGKLWDAAIKAYEDMNPQMKPGEIRAIFSQMHKEMIGEGPEAAFARVNAEFTREIPNRPTHIAVGNQVIPWLETSLYSYARRLSDHYATRVGFTKHFGQDSHPGSTLGKLRTQYLNENGETDSLVALTRSLNGVPVERPIIDPGSAMATVLRGIGHAQGVIKSTMLSASTIQNLAEPLGNLQSHSEGLDLFRAAARLIGSWDATVSALEQLGAVNLNPADLAANPNRPAESVTRIFREASARIFGHHWINELQEKMAGALAMEKVQRMRAGKGTRGDIFDLQTLMKISHAKAKDLAAGKGTDAEYNAIIRKMPTALVGNPMTAPEKTRISSNRIYKAAVAFEGYAQMQVRRFLKIAETYAKTMQETRGGVDDPRRAFAAHVKVARYLGGVTASGALAYFLMALATGGLTGLGIAASEAKDKPAQFLRDSFLYTLLSGPYGAVIRSATGDKPVGESLIRATLPGFLIAEVVDAVKGRGSYSGMGAGESMSHLAGRLLPISRVAAQGAAVMGFGSEDADMDTAIRAYWRWRRADTPVASSSTLNPNEDQAQFKLAVRQAYNRMRSGDSVGMTEAMKQALDVKGDDKVYAKSAAASIRARRLLYSLDDDQITALKNRIGEKAFSILQSHDDLLETWADSIGTPVEEETSKAAAAKDVDLASGLRPTAIADRDRTIRRRQETSQAQLEPSGE